MHSLPRVPNNQGQLLTEGYENYGSFSHSSPLSGDLGETLSVLGSWFLACQHKAVTVYSLPPSSSPAVWTPEIRPGTALCRVFIQQDKVLKRKNNRKRWKETS